jgi:histidinol-phosphatase (PHP family)
MPTIDYHVHLWAHAEPTPRPTTDGLATLVDETDVDHVVITEHFYRFHQARGVVGRFWEVDGDEALRTATARVVAVEQTADLEAYVDGIRRAQSSGLPVSLGVEVDYLPGCGPAIRSMIDEYGFDVVLGSVHWIGAWLFDAYDDPTFRAEWSRRGVTTAWDDYASAFEALCRDGWCDVLAHCDLIKVAGVTPPDRAPWEDRLAAAAIAAGVTVELSSAGWRKPIGEPYPTQRLLELFTTSGVPVVLGSDAHEPSLVGHRFDELASRLTRASACPT